MISVMHASPIGVTRCGDAGARFVVSSTQSALPKSFAEARNPRQLHNFTIDNRPRSAKKVRIRLYSYSDSPKHRPQILRASQLTPRPLQLSPPSHPPSLPQIWIRPSWRVCKRRCALVSFLEGVGHREPGSISRDIIQAINWLTSTRTG